MARDKEEYKKQKRIAAAVMLDQIADMHPEFNDLPLIEMENIVEKHIGNIIAELAIFEKTSREGAKK